MKHLAHEGSLTRFAGFALAAASVPGRHHKAAGRPNQDSYFLHDSPNCLVAVVCDGCGSETNSGVGAILGARLVAQRVAEQARGDSLSSDAVWGDIESQLLRDLKALAATVSTPDAQREFIAQHCLFTIVGVAITETLAVTFAAGDGLIASNHNTRVLGPFADNAPPYLGLSLLGAVPKRRLFAIDTMPAAALQRVLVATDGLVEAASHRQQTAQESAEELFAARWLRNPDALRRHFSLLGSEQVRADWDARTLRRTPGCFADDTTAIVLQRVRS